MFSHAENELLPQTGPGTPMGDLLRRYWLPALISRELAEPDGPQLRLRILGEDLIVFRTKDGGIDCLEPHCAHRGNSLVYGRIEERGIRCCYHGWLYDTEGACLETPEFVERMAIR